MPAYAAEHLVLVEAGFPHHTKLDDATKKHQIHGYPTIIITSASWNKKGQLGYMEGGPKAFIKALEKAK